jgi:hypothetical protein
VQFGVVAAAPYRSRHRLVLPRSVSAWTVLGWVPIRPDCDPNEGAPPRRRPSRGLTGLGLLQQGGVMASSGMVVPSPFNHRGTETRRGKAPLCLGVSVVHSLFSSSSASPVRRAHKNSSEFVFFRFAFSAAVRYRRSGLPQRPGGGKENLCRHCALARSKNHGQTR